MMKRLWLAVLVLTIALFCCMSAYAEEADSAWYELSADETVLTVRLPANSTTGYEWNFEISDPEILELVKRNTCRTRRARNFWVRVAPGWPASRAHS